MRIKSPEYIRIINSRISETLDNFIISYCTEHNKSKSEFVREAVEHYINLLNHEANRKKLQQLGIDKANSTFDEMFDKEFGK
jgi:Arc/MetJ-type ribon-helix-helix transcriptional regulator